MYFLNRIIFAALLCGLFTAQSAFSDFERVPSPKGNFCKDDMNQYFLNKFGNSELVQEIDKSSRENSEFAFWVNTTLCEGAFVLDFGGTASSDCTMAHYGKRPQYLNRVWATGDCRKYVPKDEFPDLY